MNAPSNKDDLTSGDLSSGDEFSRLLDTYHLAATQGNTNDFWVVNPASKELRDRVEQAYQSLLAFDRYVSTKQKDARTSYRLETGLIAGPEDSPLRLERFELLRELGRGGFGVVYLARDPSLNRSVAIKIPRLESLGSTSMQNRFRREAEIVAKLDHPNIVPVFEIGQTAAGMFIVSLYCPGTNLAEWFRSSDTTLTFEQMTDLMTALAEAISYCHQQGVLHRDLKPANVLLFPGQLGSLPFHPRINDFGLAKILEPGLPQATSGIQLGTPNYMAPEQADSQTHLITPAADVYALGAILYELLTGNPPYPSNNVVHLVQQWESTPLIGPRQFNSSIPDDLEAICLKCLAKDPTHRYPTATELLYDLRLHAQGKTVKASSKSTTIRDSENLACPKDPEACVRFFVKCYDVHGKEMIEHCGHLLTDDFEFFVPGDPKKLPFAGLFVGKKEFQQFLDAFHQFFDRQPFQKKPSIYTGDNAVIASYFETVHYRGQRVAPIRVNLRFRFRDGLISRVDDEFDYWAGMKALQAIVKLRASQFIQSAFQYRTSIAVLATSILVLTLGTVYWKNQLEKEGIGELTLPPEPRDRAGVRFSDSGYVYVAPIDVGTMESFTLETWIKPEIPMGMICNLDGALSIYTDNDLHGNGPSVHIHLAENQILILHTQQCLPKQRWCHLAVTFDGQSVDLFVDGVQQSIVAYLYDGETSKQVDVPQISLRSYWPGTGLVIGGNSTTASKSKQYPFYGEISEVCLSSGVRYASPFQPPSGFEGVENKMAHYCFTPEQASEIRDESFHSNAAVRCSYE